MADEGQSLVIVPRDYADIAKLQEQTVIDDLLENPIQTSLEILTGVAQLGPKTLYASLGRICQTALRSELQRGVVYEFKRLQDAGKLPDDFSQAKNAFKTWAELMDIIDTECPDADRLEALKAMFYAANKVGAADGEQAFAYQLWQIAKKLKSGELLLLKAIYENAESLNKLKPHEWLPQARVLTGFDDDQMLDLLLVPLRELRLVTPGNTAMGPKSIPTSLGLRFCHNIEAYKLDLNAAQSDQ